MFPELLSWPHFTLVLILTAALGTLTHFGLAAQMRIPAAPLLRFIAGLTAVAIVGAKLFSMAVDGPASLSRSLFSDSFRYPGAVLAVLLALPWLRRLLPPGLTLRGALDLMIPGTCVALAAIRLDCIIAGCCTGGVTTLPWGLRFPSGTRPWFDQVMSGMIPHGASQSLAVHPLSLYFVGLALLVGWLAVWFFPRRAYDGQLVLLFLAVHEAGKFLLELLRFPPVPSLLVRADNGLGGVTQVRYRPSTDFDNGGDDGAPDLPFITWVTTDIRRTDGLCEPNPDEVEPFDPFDPSANACIGQGHELVKKYHYEGGLFDADAREFRGFRTVTETDIDGNERVVTFSQDDDTRGKVEGEDTYIDGSPPGLVKRVTNVWHTKQSGLADDAGRTQVYLAEVRTETFDLDVSGGRSGPVSGDTTGWTLDQCVVTQNERPDDYGRVSKSCTLPCSGAGDPSDACAEPAPVGQVEMLTTWADPVGTSGVRERPARIITRYKAEGGSFQVLTDKTLRYDDNGTPGSDGLAVGQVEVGNVRYVESMVDQSVLGILDPAIVRTDYDLYGNVVSVTDPNGNTTTSVYDPYYFSLYPVEERAPQTIDPVTGEPVDHVVRTFTVLHYAKPLTIRGQNGEVIRYAFDHLGRVICKALPGNDINTCWNGEPFNLDKAYIYEYPANPGGPALEDSLSYVEVRTREPNAPNGYLTAYEYTDALGRLRLRKGEQVVGADSGLTTIVVDQREYDQGGRVGQVYAAYEAEDGQASPTPSVAATLYDYRLNGGSAVDPLGRPHLIDPPDPTSTEVLYEGRKTTTIDAGNDAVVAFEDDLGRKIRKELWDTGALEMKTEYTYDGMGHLLTTKVGGNDATTITVTYDSLGRKTQLDDPDSGTWKYAYDVAGNPIYTDDPEPGQHTQACFDELNRITHRCVYDGAGATNDYVADACSTACGGAAESTYLYDDTSDGNVGIGRLTSVQDRSGSEGRRYDERGRVVQHRKTIDGIDATTVFHYAEGADQLEWVGYLDGEIVTYGYNAAGQVTSVTSTTEGLTYVADLEYDLLGRPERIAYGNGVEDTYGYYGPSDGRRLHTITTALGATKYQDLSYHYNTLGKVDDITDYQFPSDGRSKTAHYEYDGLGRLSGVTGTPNNAFDASYGFDSLGNMTAKVGETLRYGDTGFGPHQASWLGDASRAMAYDANGNRLSKNSPGSATEHPEQTYAYDGLDRLLRVDVAKEGGGVDTVRYVYDYSGRRVKETDTQVKRFFSDLAMSFDGGALMKYYYAGDRLILSRGLLTSAFSGGPPAARGWRMPPAVPVGVAVTVILLLAGLGRRRMVAGVAVSRSRALGSVVLMLVAASQPIVLLPFVAEAACGDPIGVLTYHHYDHLGSTQVKTNEDGAVYSYVRYTPYGGIRGRFDASGAPMQPNAGADRHEFTGYESDHVSGLQYAGARFYDPELGMFLTQDPKAEFWNPYAYGPWDPINGTDPGGEGWFLALLIYALIVSVTMAVSTGIRTGDAGQALKVFAVTFSRIMSIANMFRLASGSTPGCLPPATTFALATASAGYGAYGSGEGAPGSNIGSLILAGLILVKGFGLEVDAEGRSASEGTSGEGASQSGEDGASAPGWGEVGWYSFLAEWLRQVSAENKMEASYWIERAKKPEDLKILEGVEKVAELNISDIERVEAALRDFETRVENEGRENALKRRIIQVALRTTRSATEINKNVLEAIRRTRERITPASPEGNP